MTTGYVVKIIRLRNIPAKDGDGFSDPYVKLKLGQQPKQKTKVVKKTLNPEFHQEFRYSTWGSSEKLTASVWDWNRLAKKVFIGQVIFSHPEHGVLNGSFPLVDQKGEAVGGTMEVSITSEYLVGVERRLSHEKRRDSGDYRLNVSGGGGGGGHSGELVSPDPDHEHKRATTPTPSQNLNSPSTTTDPPAFVTLDDSRQALAFTPQPSGSLRERERDVEREREKEREKEKERDRQRERERNEDKKRIEELFERFHQLESENKKQSVTIESLEKEVTELRQTVTGLEAWSNEGKAHGSSTGCSSWLVRIFPCCFSSTKRAISKKEIVKLDETEVSNDPVHRTNGSV